MPPFEPLDVPHHDREFVIPELPPCTHIEEAPDGCLENHTEFEEGCRGCRECVQAYGRQWNMPLSLFKLFMTQLVLAAVVVNTNLYAVSKGATDGPPSSGRGARPWRAITAAELKIWLGLVIYMSVVPATTIFDYWSRNTELPAHQISAFMSRTRFQQIKRYLHLSPPGVVPIQRWWTKLEPMASQLKANFKQYIKPRSVVSIDEIMVRFTGRSLHTVVLRGKPVPLGYKILALCDAGYVYGFLFDSPKAPFEGNVPIRNEAFDRFDWQTLVPDVQLAIRNLSATSRAVLRLCLQLPKDPSFVVYMDNYFNNIPLYQILRFFGIAACGTARRNSAGWPTEFKAAM